MLDKKTDETSVLADLLSRDELDFDEFDSFLTNWKRLADQHDTQSNTADDSNFKIEQVEGLATRALERLVQTNAKGSAGGSALFDSLQLGAVICNSAGRIGQSNDQALEEFGLHDSSTINDARLSLENGDPFDATFLTSLHDDSPLTVRQCFRGKTAVNLAVLVLETGRGEPQYLIIFLDTTWGPEAQSLFATRFKLSDVETEIVGQFVAGVPLKQIAVDRGRSYQTVRNQFQAVLIKTGCLNQVDLLRLLLGTSYLFSQISILGGASTTTTPGRSIEMARPKGRILDVQLFGNLNGEPFICLPSIFGLPITPAIEAKLREQNLLMLGIARPGFGGTSPAPSDQDLADCLAGDIKSLLDSMEIKRCVFMGRASAAPILFKILHLLPDRVSRAISVNGLVPRPYVDSQSSVSSWTKSLMAASRRSPTVATLMLGAGNRLRTQIGTARFFTRMYRRSVADTAAVLDPDVCESMERGVKYVTQQGLRAGAQDMIKGFQDWRDVVEMLPKIPVTLLHGPDDPHVPIDAVGRFAADFPDTLELVELTDGGGLLNFTHVDEILRRIRTS